MDNKILLFPGKGFTMDRIEIGIGIGIAIAIGNRIVEKPSSDSDPDTGSDVLWLRLQLDTNEGV